MLALSVTRWTGAEKKIARRAFDAALERALASTMAEFKSKAAAAVSPPDMWAVENFLRDRRREIDRIFDYRYSQLLLVFPQLIRRNYLDESQLAGLSEDKLEEIRHYLSYVRQE